MAEIQLDYDTNIKDLEEASFLDKQSKTPVSTDSDKSDASKKKQKPKSVIVRIPLDKTKFASAESQDSSSKSKTENTASSSSTVSSNNKKRKIDESYTENPSLPTPYAVPENFNIPKHRESDGAHDEKKDASPRRGRRSPARSDRRSRSPAYRRRSPVVRSRSRERGRFSRSPRRRSPRRSRSRDRYRPSPRYSRSPRRRSPSPFYPRRSPPRPFRPRNDRGFYRSPSRDFCPPRWRQGGDRFDPPGMTDPWGPPQQDYQPRFDSAGPGFRGFEDHSAQWRSPMDNLPPPTPFSDRRPDLPPPQLPLPVDTQVPSTSTDINVLKEEIKGLSATMLALTSQMTNATQTKMSSNPTKTQKESSSTTQVSRNTSNQDFASTSSVDGSTRNSDISHTVAYAPHDSEEIEDSSDSDEDSSEDEMSDEGSEAESEEQANPLPQTVDGYLDWPGLVALITEKFSDRIPPEEDLQPVTRIGNLGGLVEKKEGDRTKLPMYEPIQIELSSVSRDIQAPITKAKAKRDPKPLGRGTFPESHRTLPIQALSGNLRFNHPQQLDQGIERLLPGKKQTFTVQGKMTEENLRKLESDLRVNLSSLSYVLWSLDYATQSLEKISKKPKKGKLLNPAVSACRHALSFLSTVVDRSSISLAY